MTKDDIVSNHPLRVLGLTEKLEGTCRKFGLVMAQAGLGKTAVLVQLALDYMLRGGKVLHVSVGERLSKACRWYDDIFFLLSQGLSEEEAARLETEVMSRRMIMTFRDTAFDFTAFSERLEGLVTQDLYKPDCLIFDGYEFNEENCEASMEFFTALQQELGLATVWFSAVTHTDPQEGGMATLPAAYRKVEDSFDTVLCLQPDKFTIRLDVLKSLVPKETVMNQLAFDPSTMLIVRT